MNVNRKITLYNIDETHVYQSTSERINENKPAGI